MKLRKIVLVDDDPTFMFLTRRILKKVDYEDEVVAFNNGVKALEFLKNYQVDGDQEPSVVFLDLNMPQMDGFQFLEEFQKMQDSIRRFFKVVILTTSSMDRDRRRALGYQEVIAYLEKPFSKDKLNYIVENWNKLVGKSNKGEV